MISETRYEVKRLTFEEYAEDAGATARYPNRGDNIIYPVLGLTGEAGEVAEKVKKLLRDQDGVIDEEFRQAIKKELGDVLWYLTAMAYELGFSLEEVAEANIEKLHSRRERGKIHGSGDDR
jgi:NTP pyrophosphatase (non-canonical NTP hydrolase)